MALISIFYMFSLTAPQRTWGIRNIVLGLACVLLDQKCLSLSSFSQWPGSKCKDIYIIWMVRKIYLHPTLCSGSISQSRYQIWAIFKGERDKESKDVHGPYHIPGLIDLSKFLPWCMSPPPIWIRVKMMFCITLSIHAWMGIDRIIR